MKIVNYISNIAIPAVILIILLYGLFERKNVFDIFLKGAEDGAKMVIKLFPTLIGLFLAIGALSSSGILDFLVNLISPVLNIFKFPSEILPLAMLRPISGSASLAILNSIYDNHGPDSFIGLLASVMQGSTDTTMYVITLYFGSIGIKKIRYALWAGLCADLIGIVASIVITNILF